MTSDDTQHNDHIWLTWCGEGWAIERIEDDVIYLWRGYASDLEFLKVRWSRTYWPDYARRAARMAREGGVMTTYREGLPPLPVQMARKLKAHIWAREEHEHYVEEPWVSKRLFEKEVFTGPVLDPACGFGHIVQSAWAAGLTACGTDIVDRGGTGCIRRVDFFDNFAPHINIVCNPPFDIIREFTEHAVRHAASKVAMICPTRRLNAAGVWLQALPLARIWYLTPRPSMPPGHVYRELVSQGKRPSGGTQDFCWLVFNKAHSGPWTGGWLHRDSNHGEFKLPAEVAARKEAMHDDLS